MTSLRPPPSSCPQCGSQLAPTLLACPYCARLVHADALAALAKSARAAADRGDTRAALAAWRDALVLLPDSSKQYRVIAGRITELGRDLPSDIKPIPTATGGPILRAVSRLGVLGVMLWKAKTLLLGLTKGTTLFSMLLSLGVYWTVWGWQFALGLVLSIYIHEMGHVVALHRYGFRATAPTFIPGLGALIRLQQAVVNPREDAAIGLAGPIYGLGAAVAALAIWWGTGQPIFAVIASVGAWINLFNLLPIGSLDGGRGFRSMSRTQRLIGAATAAAAWYAADDGLLMIVALVCFWRSASDISAKENCWKVTATYCFLVLALTAISTIRMQVNTAASVVTMSSSVGAQWR